MLLHGRLASEKLFSLVLGIKYIIILCSNDCRLASVLRRGGEAPLAGSP